MTIPRKQEFIPTSLLKCVSKTRSGVRVAHVEVFFVGERKRETEDEKIKEDKERYIHEIDRQIDR